MVGIPGLKISDIEALKAIIKVFEERENQWSRFIHPDFGPCDTLGTNGVCSECFTIFTTMKGTASDLDSV